jgi:hypothetical protein
MKDLAEEDQAAIIEHARKTVNDQKERRNAALALATMFLGYCGWCAWKIVSKLDTLDPSQLNAGFVSGFALAIVASCFGVLGGLFLAQAIIGWSGGDAQKRLLLKYHDELAQMKRESQNQQVEHISNSADAV